MKRAAIIKIYRQLEKDPPYWRTDTDEMPHLLDGTGEQLLADLRVLVEKAERHPVSKSVADAAARVRAAIGDTE